MEKSTDLLAYKVPEAAHLAGISERHLWRLIARKEGPALVRIGHRIVIRREALVDWLKSQEGAAA